MNKQAREALDAYYVEAGSWAEDRQDELRKSRKTAWTVALIAAVVALLLALALIVLLPLKTVEPYTLLVDRQTGFVQALEPLNPERISGDTALTQSFLTQYVIAREGFDADALQVNYRRVSLWSADTARSSYISGQQASNPDSPLARYPRTTIVETRVKSISPISANVAMVRFETQRRDAGGQAQPPQAWVAVIRYRYSGAPMRMEDRLINPLGFEVLHYQRNAEALPPEPEPSATPPPTTVKPVVVVPAQQQPGQAAPQQAPQQPPAQPRGPEVEL
ncbi:MAG TPA: type IV secretion system protein [Allosphingosinicella sp.]|jgi:type IV secretion system protein VirB8|nr:type IV secretion system protein [Allosphingosinicella sp.]